MDSAQDSFPNEKIFVVEAGASDAAYSMLAKMVAALQYQPSEVTFLQGTPENIEILENHSFNKKLLFFGNQFPGRFGEAMHWSSHQSIQTHALESLLQNPGLKKETWEHLKNYSRLK